MARRKKVVIGLLGTTLDLGKQSQRWDRWRPTVALCQHEDLLVDRLELLSSRRYASLAKRVTDDIRQVSPETEVVHRELEFEDAWDLEEVYGSLFDFARAYPWAPEKEDYFVHITTGTHIAQISMFLLAEAHHIPARLLQTSPPTRGQTGVAGTYAIIDLDLSKYDRIAARFRREQKEGLSFLKSGIDTRNAAFNRAHRADRAGGDPLAGSAAAHGADRRRQVAARAADLRAEEGRDARWPGSSWRSTAPRYAATAP